MMGLKRDLAVAGGILAAVGLLMAGTTCVLAPPAGGPTVAAVPTMAATAMPSPPRTPTPGASTVASPAVPSPSPARSPVAAAPSPVATPWWERENQPDPALVAEVDAAYRRYGDVRGQALYDLDSSQLDEVADGAELDRERGRIEQLRGQGRAVRLDGQHASRVVFAAGGEAVVYDEFLNDSVFVDAASKRELPAESPPFTQRISYLLRNIDGKWKVVDAVQHQS